MLQAIRSKAGSLVVKLLFAVLIVAFGFWGIGNWINDRSVDTTVATVGSAKIRAEQLVTAVRAQIQTLRQRTGGAFDVEQAKQFGIVSDQLDQIIDNSLVNQEVSRLDLAVGDTAVRAVILGNSAFQNPPGQFDPQRYKLLLNSNRMTEAQYEAQVRSDLILGALANAVGAGGSAPKPLVDTVYRSIAEKRVADTVFVPYSSATEIGEPADSDLADFYGKHPEIFRAPELRTFTVAYLKLADLAKTISVSDEEAKQEYDRRLDDLKLPERRHLEQIVVPDQATADQVLSALKGGRTFATVAKEIAKLEKGPVDLGTVSAGELDGAQLADAAFKTAAGGVSDPVHDSFGWHILHVISIEPAGTQSFADAKAKIVDEISRDAAENQTGRIVNKVDDGLAGGAALEKIAGDLDLKLATADAVDQTGHALDGKAAELPTPPSEILASAFSAPLGQVSNVENLSDGGFYVVRVDKITPSAVRPLADVRDRALAAWQQDQRVQHTAKSVTEIVDAVGGGATLKQTAEQRKLAVTATPQLVRGREEAALPQTVVTAIFGAKPHEAVQAATADGIYVAELTEVIAADPAAAEPEVDRLSTQLGQQIQADLHAEFAQALRQHFPVQIDQAQVDRAF